jgi:hypothetical protein
MLQQLIQNARRRLLFNEALKQFALSAALAIAGLALLLTLGTRYVEWWVVVLFAVGVTAWAAAKLRKRLPSAYTAAVWLDNKAGLHDALSTAHYFATRAAAASPDEQTPESEAMLRAQRGQAEAAAGAVDVSITVPFRFPKALYGLAALMLVSTGLVTLRYFYGHNLNLNAPITEVIFQDLAAAKTTKVATTSGRNPNKLEDYDEARSLLSKLGLGTDLDESQDEKLDQALADALQSAEKTAGGSNDAKLDQTKEGDPIDAPPKDAPNSNGPPSGDNSTKNPGANSNASNSQSGSKSGDNTDKSLLSKLKDAMDSMMGTPSPQSEKKSGGDQQPKSSPGQSEGGQQGNDPGEDGQQMPPDSAASGSAQKGNSPGQSSGTGGDKSEGPSAAGAEDGEKAIRAAAQIKAMGKISELIGKRSEQVTGESMIEVQSGNQKLQTTYKDKAATHGEGAGEVSRDEIPLSVQAYVQEYFQEVRKPAGKPAKAPATEAPPAAK